MIARFAGLFLSSALKLFGVMLIIGVETPYTLIGFAPVFCIFYFCQKYFQTTSRELKRLDAITRSPVYAHFSECLAGLSTIRAYKRTDAMGAANARKLDGHICMNLAQFSANRWLGIRLETLGGVLVFLAALFLVIAGKQIDASAAGLQLSYALQITQLLNMVVRIFSLVENSMNAVERIKEYSELTPERPAVIEDARPDDAWPEEGGISYEGVFARYRPDLDPVLNGLEFKVAPHEQIGVCGRTGAGKSSLFLTLFRIVERDAASGPITIDGIDIADIGLEDLRRKIAIIPPVRLFLQNTVWKISRFRTLF